MKAFENLEFAHSGTKVTVLPGGESAYAISRYTIKAKMGDRLLDNEGLETLLLVKTSVPCEAEAALVGAKAGLPAEEKSPSPPSQRIS